MRFGNPLDENRQQGSFRVEHTNSAALRTRIRDEALYARYPKRVALTLMGKDVEECFYRAVDTSRLTHDNPANPRAKNVQGPVPQPLKHGLRLRTSPLASSRPTWSHDLGGRARSRAIASSGRGSRGCVRTGDRFLDNQARLSRRLHSPYLRLEIVEPYAHKDRQI